MLKAALCGNYVNFGVFRLYGDSALDEALKMFVKLLVSIELKNLLVSPADTTGIYPGHKGFSQRGRRCTIYVVHPNTP